MRIVIAGAGPIGLYLAIMLKRLTQKTDHEIVVLDRRAGAYSRPGIVAKKAVDAIEEGLRLHLSGISSANDTGEAIFIKDLENALYQVASQQFKVKFIKENFIRLDGKLVNPETIALSADFIFDCTGKPRHVVTYLNQISGTEKPFHSVQIADNPHKNHFIANIAFDVDQLKKIKLLRDSDINPLAHATSMARLRDSFQWDAYSEPDLALYPMPELYHSKKVYYLYYEIPDALLSAGIQDKQAWLKSLLALKTGHDDIEFTILDGPMAFIPFAVDPHQLKETHALASPNGPIIIPAGDAQIEQDYRMGIAILFGVLRLKALFQSLIVGHDTIQFIPELYATHLAPMLDYQMKNIKSEYSNITSKIASSLDKELKYFTEAVTTCEDTSTKELLNKHIATIYQMKATVALDKAAQFKPLALGQSQLYKHDVTAYQVAVLAADDFFTTSKRYSPSNNQRFASQLAINIKDIGNLYFKIECYQDAIDCYKKAIDTIDTNVRNPANDTTRLSCVSNIMMCINKLNQYNETDIQYANESHRIISNDDIDKDMMIKMANNACLIYLRELNNSDFSDEGKIDDLNAIKRNIDDLIDKMRSQAHTQSQRDAIEKLVKLKEGTMAELSANSNKSSPTLTTK